MLGIVFIIIAYVVGSIETGILVCKYKGLPDPRTQGSGSAGATNVLRLGGTSVAAMVLIGDALKGLIVVLFALLFGVTGTMLGLVAVAAVVGHIYPVFYDFKGGKGIATAFGGLLVLEPPVAILGLVTWIIIAGLFRYSSLASVVSAVLVVIYSLVIPFDFRYFFPILLMTCLIVWRHWDNIQRLMSGSESQINFDHFMSTKSKMAEKSGTEKTTKKTDL